MHPAPSLIVFTTLSGAGFGMLAFLGFDVPAPRGGDAAWQFALAFLLAAGGLSASVFHLGHPERALKAFSQWRSSWLSREGVLAVATLILAAGYATGLVLLDARLRVLGVLSGAGALLTVFATAMIYMQMRSVPRWNHWSPPVLFLGYAVTAGALLTARVWPAVLLLVAMAAVQVIAWLDQARREAASDTDRATATGLGHRGKVRALFPPHSGDNYLTREMVFRVARRRARALRVVAVVLGMALPAAILLLAPEGPGIAAAAVLHLAGVMVQRWLFFAEARHVVSFYY